MRADDNHTGEPGLIRRRRRDEPAPYVAFSGPRSRRRNELAATAGWVTLTLCVFVLTMILVRQVNAPPSERSSLARMEHVSYALSEDSSLLVFRGGHQVGKVPPDDPKYISLRYLLAEHGMPAMSSVDRKRAKALSERQQEQIESLTLKDLEGLSPEQEALVTEFAPGSERAVKAADSEFTEPVAPPVDEGKPREQ